jgi:hypothetical protein
MDQQPLSRRAFLGRAAIAAAAAGVGVALTTSTAGAADKPSPAKAKKGEVPSAPVEDTVPAAPTGGDTVETFALDPVGGGSSCRGGTGNGTCAACAACKKHAENKIFRTKDAADKYRAHRGCRCQITAGQVVDTDVAAAVFAKGDVADKRDPETGGLLTPGHGVTVPVMAATLPVIAVGGGALGYYLMRRHDRTVAAVDVDRGDWK